ncbi:MAG: MFS transporter [Acidobacteria bacterium]|nr:MFS transporter [Acidobacteriota bacterium]
MAPEPDPPYPPPRRAWSLVGVLTIVYVFSFVDRQILSLLVQPVRRDLAISDTQMSLLMGASFALFYTFFGIPLGRAADSRSRRWIVALGFAAWSLFTAACGLATTFPQMLALRMGVGVGEAALAPAAYSLIADSFEARKRATALGVYSTGIYVGAGLAFVVGGTIVGLAASWRTVFFAVGLPGLALAPLVLAMREPARRGDTGGGSATVRDVSEWFRANAETLVCHNLGCALMALGGYAITAWAPAFLSRRYGLGPAEAGLAFGAVVLLAGSAGVIAGGRYADRLAARGRRDANLRVAAMTSLACLPFATLFPLAPGATAALALLVPTMFFGSVVWGVAPAAIQEMMPNSMRGQASAVYLFAVNAIGLGLGPTAVALLTDRVFGDERAVGWSLAIVGCGAYLSASALLALSLRPFARSLDYLRARTAQ